MSKTVDLWKNITVIFHKLCEKGGVAKKYKFVIFVTLLQNRNKSCKI